MESSGYQEMFQLASANDQPAPVTTICFLFFWDSHWNLSLLSYWNLWELKLDTSPSL